VFGPAESPAQWREVLTGMSISNPVVRLCREDSHTLGVRPGLDNRRGAATSGPSRTATEGVGTPGQRTHTEGGTTSRSPRRRIVPEGRHGRVKGHEKHPRRRPSDERGSGSHPRPLVLTHGWRDSFATDVSRPRRRAMCPGCPASLMLIAAGGSSAGTLAAVVVKDVGGRSAATARIVQISIAAPPPM
jgi:hypothetical protein